MFAALLQSLLVGTMSTLIALLLGVPAAWKLSAKRGGMWRAALVALPLALPAPVAISGWVQLIAPDAASSFAIPIPGLNSIFRSLLFGPVGASCVLGFGLWPLVALHVWPAFLRTRDEVYESAQLSVSPSRAFFQAVLPRCWGEIAAGAALVFVLASSDFASTSLLLVKTLAVGAHDSVALGKFSLALWQTLPLGVLAAALGTLFARTRTRPSQTQTSPTKRAGILPAGALWAGVILGFALPMLFCLRGVLSSGKAPSAAFHAGASSLGLSVRLAAAASLLACSSAAVRVLFWPQNRTPVLNAIGVFLLAIPGAGLGVCLLRLQTSVASPAQNFAPAWLALGFAIRFVFIPLRLVEEGLAALDPALFESAALLGQSRYSRALSIALPLVSGHLAAAAALVFVLALGEVSVAAVLSPPGVTPATIWLFNQQHMGYDESVFALSLLLGGAACAAVFLGALVSKWVADLR